ncbi:helix-turn-helix transcriptional regulator [Globicatella sanguinis]
MQDKLIALRRGSLLTQSDMAKIINVDLRTYQAKERGESQFKLNEMFAISEHFGMTMDEIFLNKNFIKHEI